jgi:hypothetical protein
MTRRLGRAALVLVALASGATATPLPRDAADVHRGVAECATPLCHNAVTPWQGSRVRLNEYRVWRERDRHARAYTALETPLGSRIGRALGIDSTTAKECLDCHTDAVPPERRGSRYAAADGVGCEACHGGAERWLETHATSASRRDDLDRGMYPTDEPRARAELCLSCHLGGDGRVVTHRLLAAGHPRLSFELDTFSELAPPHWTIGEASIQRKGKPVPKVKMWAIGQAVALGDYLALLAAAPAGHYDFALFDCAACHHDLGTRAPRDAKGALGLGLPGASGAPFVLYQKVLAMVAPADASAIAGEAAALADALAVRSEDVPSRARALRERVAATVDVIAAAPLDERRLLAELAACGRSPDDVGYLVAEQLVMAIQATLAGMHGEQSLADDPDVRRLLATTERLGSFDAARFRRALDAFCHRS